VYKNRIYCAKSPQRAENVLCHAEIGFAKNFLLKFHPSSAHRHKHAKKNTKKDRVHQLKPWNIKL
jgi:hypothetical protein